jgi:uncharacterized SAM-binding protein YcdF (DUF218 family)
LSKATFKVLFVPSAGIRTLNQPDNHTQKRLTETFNLWAQGQYYNLIVVAGGIFNPATIQTLPAAAIMKDWLVFGHIPAEKILTEGKSRDTFENVRYSVEKLAAAGFLPDNTELTILTHWQHAIRTAYTFKKYGFKVKQKKLWYWIGLVGTLKEFGFIIYHWLDPKGKWLLAKKNQANRTFS